MAKKRKAPRKSEPTGPREVDTKDARLTVRTYKDVANSEDEFYADKDEINFDSDNGGRSSKRRRKQEREEAFLEASDEEILGGDDSDSDEEEEAPKKGKAAGKSKAKVEAYSEDEEQEGEPEEGDEGWWGSSKKEYYDADKIETEADALVSLFHTPARMHILTVSTGGRGRGEAASGQEAVQDAGGGFCV